MAGPGPSASAAGRRRFAPPRSGAGRGCPQTYPQEIPSLVPGRGAVSAGLARGILPALPFLRKTS
ncbi:hypothetical protein HMPREF0731_4282 [Pseudoroseomonas cervicalis ATCC 49957]|uniref:Uncharacterized protein n=1 Tax=Pseudoroseomonas cervicalis ATCC 49957 TaxID=525371 RepID=D5RT70_9PROT|nr:hypothetical protein HMPREF0731_4282 [Pseudoroseomonas cervicalis ATCC 49957]